MTKQPLSDEDLIAREKRKFRESLIVGLIFGLALSALIVLYVYADRHGILRRQGFTQNQIDDGFSWFLGIVLCGYVLFALIRYWTPKAARQPRVLRKDMDNIHGRWRVVMLLLLFVAIMETYNYSGTLPTLDLGTSAAFVVLLVMLAPLLCFGPGFISRTYRETLNDELIRSMRAKAARLGYLILMLALGGLYFVFVHAPQLALRGLVWSLLAGGAIPTLYFLFLEWRAGRGD